MRRDDPKFIENVLSVQSGNKNRNKASVTNSNTETLLKVTTNTATAFFNQE